MKKKAKLSDECIATNKEIYKRILFLLHIRKIKQIELARSVGVIPQTVYEWKNGRQPQSDKFLKICDFLNVTPNALYGYDENLENAIKSFETLQNFARENFGGEL